ncbi:hypothetical protein ACFPVX_14140 [Cohnella faecalis]|uniref:Thioredoxin domain-containing protein n=1 Tax=Cohnella faecalis TaxID=2315694 RepID=A0A398CJ52_9BACL|nr:hypothetical protein [Cohnella faecalis]RIE02365.1 hypothetical protein D3H35_16760 [Cohnella faecalis]
MSPFFAASYVLLWLVVFLLAYIVLAMAKRIYRISLPASDRGIQVGVSFPFPNMKAFQRRRLGAGSVSSGGTLVFFTASDCDACKRVYPVIDQFQRANANYDYALFMVASEEEGASILEPYANAFEAAFVDDLAPFEVPGVPFAYYLSAEGKVLSKGIFHEALHINHLIATGKKANRKLA